MVYKGHRFAQQASHDAISRNDAQRTPMEGLGKGINACRKRKRSSETLPAEGIGYIPVTRGHREGFGDCAMCH